VILLQEFFIDSLAIKGLKERVQGKQESQALSVVAQCLIGSGIFVNLYLKKVYAD